MPEPTTGTATEAAVTPTPTAEPSVTTPAPETAQSTQTVNPYADVKYYSQLDKETAGNKDVMDRVKDFKSVSDLAKGYSDLRGKMDRSLLIPDQNSTDDEVKEYFRKLGVPENEQGYQLTDGDYRPEVIKDLKEQFRSQVLYRNGLTKVQGEKVWEAALGMLKAERDRNIANYEEAKKSFNQRHEALLMKDYPVASDRKAVMNEDISYASEFLAETGLGKFFKDVGLIYNPDVIHKVAQYHKTRSARAVMGSTGNSKPESNEMFTQGKQFTEAYGK